MRNTDLQPAAMRLPEESASERFLLLGCGKSIWGKMRIWFYSELACLVENLPSCAITEPGARIPDALATNVLRAVTKQEDLGGVNPGDFNALYFS